MFKGIASVWARTTDLGTGTPAEQYMLSPQMYSFEYNPNSSTKDARAFTEDAVLAIASSVEGGRDDQVILTFEEQNWGQLGFIFNERPKATGAINLPRQVITNVPLTAPYEIPIDTWYDTGFENFIFAQILTRGAWGEVGSLTRSTGAPLAGQYQVNTAVANSEKLVFNAAQAGAPIAYLQIDAYATGGQQFGGLGASLRWGTFEVYGSIILPTHDQGIKIHFPRCFITSSPQITIDDGVPQLQMTAKAATPQGWGKPYRMINMDSLA